jgi:hypothetical protein
MELVGQGLVSLVNKNNVLYDYIFSFLTVRMFLKRSRPRTLAEAVKMAATEIIA